MLKRIVGLTALLAVAGILFMGAAPQKAPEKLKIIVATDATWPPMEMVNEKKEIVGYDIDLMKAVADKAGFTVIFKNTAWDGIFAGLANGDYDAVISSVTITTDRLQTLDFSTPYINAGQVLIVRTSDKKASKLTDLIGKKVGAQIGTTGAFEIEKVKGCNLKTYDEIGLAIEDLANGRLDGVVADTPIAANYALQNAKYKGKLKIVGQPFTQEFYGIAVKKGNMTILSIINRGLKIVLSDRKTLDKLSKKWLR